VGLRCEGQRLGRLQLQGRQIGGLGNGAPANFDDHAHMLSSGPGSESRAAIGWVIFAGLGLAAAVTLFLTPASTRWLPGLQSRAPPPPTNSASKCVRPGVELSKAGLHLSATTSAGQQRQ
jgi:hypothetical protein